MKGFFCRGCSLDSRNLHSSEVSEFLNLVMDLIGASSLYIFSSSYRYGGLL